MFAQARIQRVADSIRWPGPATTLDDRVMRRLETMLRLRRPAHQTPTVNQPASLQRERCYRSSSPDQKNPYMFSRNRPGALLQSALVARRSGGVSRNLLRPGVCEQSVPRSALRRRTEKNLASAESGIDEKSCL